LTWLALVVDSHQDWPSREGQQPRLRAPTPTPLRVFAAPWLDGPKCAATGWQLVTRGCRSDPIPVLECRDRNESWLWRWTMGTACSV